MTSLKILNHIDGIVMKKLLMEKLKPLKTNLIMQLGVNKTCLSSPRWVPVYHSFQKRVRTTPLSVRVITEIIVYHRASAVCLVHKIVRS